MKQAIPWLALVLLVAIGTRLLFPVQVTVPGIPTIVTDTQYVEHVIVEQRIKELWRERVITDTVNLTTEVVISDPVYFPAPELPRIRGITHLSVAETYGDTTEVAVLDVQAAGSDIAVQRSVEKLYTPGPLLYLEASDPIRYDFGTFTEPDPCGFGCRMLWAAGGMAAGVIVWELAR